MGVRVPLLAPSIIYANQLERKFKKIFVQPVINTATPTYTLEEIALEIDEQQAAGIYFL